MKRCTFMLTLQRASIRSTSRQAGSRTVASSARSSYGVHGPRRHRLRTRAQPPGSPRAPSQRQRNTMHWSPMLGRSMFNYWASAAIGISDSMSRVRHWGQPPMLGSRESLMRGGLVKSVRSLDSDSATVLCKGGPDLHFLAPISGRVFARLPEDGVRHRLQRRGIWHCAELHLEARKPTLHCRNTPDSRLYRGRASVALGGGTAVQSVYCVTQ
jgi:hypothetical protein